MSDVDWNNIKADGDEVKVNKGEEINITIEKQVANAFEPNSKLDVVGHYASHKDDKEVVIPLEKLGQVSNTIKDLMWDCSRLVLKFPTEMIHEDRVVEYALVDPTMPEIKKATDGSAAMDLYNRLDETIPPFAMGYKIPLNVKLDLNNHWWVLLAARSSFAMKHGLLVSNSIGVIDSDYKDELALLVFNPTSEIKKIPKGTRIAQMIFMPTTGCPFKRVDDIESNPDHKGFGSSGK